MKHEQALELAARATESELDRDTRAELDAHLAGCEDCRQAVAALRWATAELSSGAPPLPASLVADISARTAPPSRPDLRWLAASVVIGALLGAWITSLGQAPVAAGPGPDRDAFVLLLEEPTERWPPAEGSTRTGYEDWARRLGSESVLGGGRRLDETEGWYVATDGGVAPAHAAPARSVNFSGFFVVYAEDYEGAIDIARSSPHLAWGGVLVRRVR